MALTTIGKLPRGQIYAFIFGAEGVGKTTLAMSLADANGRGVAFVTSDQSGPTSLLTQGFPSDIPVDVLPGSGIDPFPATIRAIQSFANDKSIHCISLDNVTTLCGRAVDYLSNGEGEKAMGWDGWGQLLAGFRQIESACDRATRAGKSVIITAWEAPPTYEDTLGGRVLKEEGRGDLQGKAKRWVPGNCDIIARMTCRFVTESIPGGKSRRVFKGQLHTQRYGEAADYAVKSRWNIPSPCPADLRWILNEVKKQGSNSSSNPVPRSKPVAVKK